MMISLQKLKKSYDTSGSGGSGPAVDEVSLEVQPGEFFTLLGPSGCGKTTTLRMLAGLIEPDEGRIVVERKVLLRQGERRGRTPKPPRGWEWCSSPTPSGLT